MKLVLIMGNAAVGKMTVGQELAKITDLRLFHNHMTIEPVIEVFGDYRPETIARLRQVIFEDFATSDRYGLIFTFMMDFDDPHDWSALADITDIFTTQGAEVYYAELIAPQAVRLARNVTKNRLAHKPSKRDIEFSRDRLLRDDREHRCVSHEGEILFENYLRIDNSDLPPAAVARLIRDTFAL